MGSSYPSLIQRTSIITCKCCVILYYCSAIHNVLSVCRPGIVLIIGATAWQRQLITSELSRSDPALQPPTDINNEVPAWQRTQLYAAAHNDNNITTAPTATGRLELREDQQQEQQQHEQQAADNARDPAGGSGGCSSSRRCHACFVTTRILVVDLLSNRLRPSQIAGNRTQQ